MGCKTEHGEVLGSSDECTGCSVIALVELLSTWALSLFDKGPDRYCGLFAGRT
jgi:hypothetical protein